MKLLRGLADPRRPARATKHPGQGALHFFGQARGRTLIVRAADDYPRPRAARDHQVSVARGDVRTRGITNDPAGGPAV